LLSAQSKERVLVPFFLFPKTERQKEEGEWESIFVGHVIAAIGLWKDGFSLCTIQRNGSLNRCIGSMDGIWIDRILMGFYKISIFIIYLFYFLLKMNHQV
jgi:hypothetical protein